MNYLILQIGRGGTMYDISQLLVKAVWSGRKGSAPRTLEATLFDGEQLKKRAPVDVSAGQTVLLYETDENGKNKLEIFQGLLMSEKRRSDRLLTIKAYDICIRFTNNKDSFSYKKVTASGIFTDCCGRLGLSCGTVAGTGHVIGELVKKATTYWDVIEDALSQTYKTTKARYYVYAEKGKVNLMRRSQPSTMQRIELGHNIESYERNRSIENTRTRLKLVTSEGVLKNNTVVGGLEAKIGRFQEFESVDEKITQTEILSRVNVFQMEQAIIGQTMKVTALGNSKIKAGSVVYVDINTVGMKRAMFVEADTHTWEKGRHLMTLDLDTEVS